jgi:hypothetical protein
MASDDAFIGEGSGEFVEFLSHSRGLAEMH